MSKTPRQKDAEYWQSLIGPTPLDIAKAERDQAVKERGEALEFLEAIHKMAIGQYHFPQHGLDAIKMRTEHILRKHGRL